MKNSSATRTAEYDGQCLYATGRHHGVPPPVLRLASLRRICVKRAPEASVALLKETAESPQCDATSDDLART
jgi:hypothetical protein